MLFASPARPSFIFLGPDGIFGAQDPADGAAAAGLGATDAGGWAGAGDGVGTGAATGEGAVPPLCCHGGTGAEM